MTIKEYIDTRLCAIEIMRQEALAHLEKRLDEMADDIDSLLETRAQLQGKASQSALTITAIIAVVGIVLSIASLLIRTQ